VGNFINTQNKERNQETQVSSIEPVAIEEQLSIEGHFPIDKTVTHKRTSSTAEQSIETGVLAEQMSLERSSPPSFVTEVNIINYIHTFKTIFSKLIFRNLSA
jgi:hypothetical protein